MQQPSVSIPPEVFPQTFPFHIAFGRDLRIVQLGPALAQLCPQPAVGRDLTELFRIEQPALAADFETISRQVHMPFLLAPSCGGLLLRGQMLPLPEAELMLFLGVPTLSSLEDLKQVEAGLHELPIYDPSGPLISLLAAQLRTNEVLMLRLAETEQAAAISRANTSRLTALIESLRGGVLVEDQHGRIVLANQSLCTLFAIPVPPEALIGADCAKAAEDLKNLFEGPEQFLARIEELLHAQRIVVSEELRLVDGRTFERDYVPIWIDSNYGGHLWQYRDISERKATEQALARARDEALAASRHKSEFLAMVSHELRTPMSGVIGMTELLLDTHLDQEQRELATTISEAAAALLAILNDILDYSKIEANRLILDRVSLAPATLITGVVGVLNAQAQARGLQLLTTIDPRIPPMIYGDAGRLRQILLNLLGNAIKFTRVGTVSLNASVLDLDTQRVTLRLEISDTGIGIPLEAQGRLFQSFSQADGSVTREFGGTGLGLAICKRLVELMGGTIGFHSVVNQGSIFWFEIGFELASLSQPEPPVAPPQLPTANQQPAAGHILLVEDMQVNQRLALRQLARLGYSADVASNGREALALLRSAPTRYSLILMDCQMPELDGYSTTRIIRSDEQVRGGHLPIIAMTANALQSDLVACLEAGMDDVLVKPVNRHTLQARLEQWLHHPSRVVALEEELTSDLMLLSAEDPDAFAELVEQYSLEQHRLINELWVALGLNDSAHLARAAHSLRGSSASIGAQALAEQCARLEQLARANQLDNADTLLKTIVKLADRACSSLKARLTSVTAVVQP